jgi:hypothetical protein
MAYVSRHRAIKMGVFRCSRTGPYGVRPLFARCSLVVRPLFGPVRTVFARCSYGVRTVFARCSPVVRPLFAYPEHRTRTTERARLTWCAKVA